MRSRELETIKEGEFKEIVITEPYALAAMETTIEQWTGPSERKSRNQDGTMAFERPPDIRSAEWTLRRRSTIVRKLTELERQKGTLPDGYVYKLPTEEMWEYACRAGTKGGFSLPVKTIANHYWPGKDNADIKTEKDLKPNPWGFHHMNGKSTRVVQTWGGQDWQVGDLPRSGSSISAARWMRPLCIRRLPIRGA